ncbi:hypothetical protein [Candidatus Thiosymbion oneisti]|uniref:hypothetical protein n=1 Tax=Candidatus Thiosymbion oneisti TaxID=589554 RepID=UPI000B7DBE45|nr:hypothetical protein [Candidatus Thiosymbion oneisti]
MKMAFTFFLFLVLLFSFYVYNKQNTDWLIAKKTDTEASIGSGGGAINIEIKSYRENEITERAKEIDERNNNYKHISSIFFILASVFTIIYIAAIPNINQEKIKSLLTKILTITISILVSGYVYLTTEIDRLNLCGTVLFYEGQILSDKEKNASLPENEVKLILFSSNKRIGSCK